nr:hypothetical protein [uncultured Caproiciproducens sp.]
MENFHPAKKLIAVSDKKGHTISILKDILVFCDHENYLLASAGEIIPDHVQPAVLLLCDPEKPNAEGFAVCVADYAFSAMPEISALKPLTYSTVSDSADFTARNIRKMPDGFTAFEIIGVGVIGRAKLAVDDTDSVVSALAATAAAIACGIPFAEVLDALNNIQINVKKME